MLPERDAFQSREAGTTPENYDDAVRLMFSSVAGGRMHKQNVGERGDKPVSVLPLRNVDRSRVEK